jgi:hypothetical protein
VVKLKEAAQTAHRYSSIIRHLLMGTVLKNRNGGQPWMHFCVERYGHEPTLVVMYVPKHGAASTSDSQFWTNYQVLIHVFPFHMKLQYKDFSCKPVHEHNFMS